MAGITRGDRFQTHEGGRVHECHYTVARGGRQRIEGATLIVALCGHGARADAAVVTRDAISCDTCQRVIDRRADRAAVEARRRSLVATPVRTAWAATAKRKES